MKFSVGLIFLFAVTLGATMALPQAALADDGAAKYKAKCAGCHGADGGGKMGPALKGTSLTDDQIVDVITKGNDAKKAPHKKPLSGLSADDAKAVADFVKSLK